MTVSDDTIAIATVCDWLKNFVPDFHPMRNKTVSNHTLYA